MQSNSETADYLTIFPELLSLEELKYAIKQRHPRLANVSSMSYETALTVFRTMIMPLPQRDFNTSCKRAHRLQQRRKRLGLQAEPYPKTSFSTTPSKRLAPTDHPRDSSAKVKIRAPGSARSSTETVTVNDRSVSNSQTKSHKRGEPAGNDNGGDLPDSKSKRQKITWP